MGFAENYSRRLLEIFPCFLGLLMGWFGCNRWLFGCWNSRTRESFWKRFMLSIFPTIETDGLLLKAWKTHSREVETCAASYTGLPQKQNHSWVWRFGSWKRDTYRPQLEKLSSGNTHLHFLIYFTAVMRKRSELDWFEDWKLSFHCCLGMWAGCVETRLENGFLLTDVHHQYKAYTKSYLWMNGLLPFG